MFKMRGKIGDGLTYLPTDVENPRYSPKTSSLRFRNFFSKRNFDIEFEISFVGTMDISLYTQSEQRRVAGKHLTRLAKNSMAAVTYIATLLCESPSFR